MILSKIKKLIKVHHSLQGGHVPYYTWSIGNIIKTYQLFVLFSLPNRPRHFVAYSKRGIIKC